MVIHAVPSMVGFVDVICEFPMEMPLRNKDVAAKYFLTFYPGADEAAAIFGTSVGKVWAGHRSNDAKPVACLGMLWHVRPSGGRIAERKVSRPSGDDGSISKL